MINIAKWWENQQTLSKLLDVVKKAAPPAKEVLEGVARVDEQNLDSSLRLLMKKEDFASVAKIVGSKPENNLEVCHAINQYEAQTLKTVLAKKDFFALLQTQTHAPNPARIYLPQFTVEETTDLVNTLWQATCQYLLPSYRNASFVKMLSFFHHENRDTIQNMVVDILPHQVLVNQDFFHSQGQESSLFTKPYSNEQIYRAWQNLHLHQDWFASEDDEACLNSFMRNNFFSLPLMPREEKRQALAPRLQNYRDFINWVKDKDATLYVLLSHRDIYGEAFTVHSSQYENWDNRLCHEFFIKEFDHDIFLAGLKQIIEKYKNPAAQLNSSILHEALLMSIHNHGYHFSSAPQYSNEYSRQSKYHSRCSSEQSTRIFSLLYEHAPMFLLNQTGLARIEQNCNFIRQHIAQYGQEEYVKNFLFPDDAFTPTHFRPSSPGQPAIIAHIIESYARHGISNPAILDMVDMASKGEVPADINYHVHPAMRNHLRQDPQIKAIIARARHDWLQNNLATSSHKSRKSKI